MEIDYFKSYAGRERPYNDVALEHSAIDECLDLFDKSSLPKLKSMIVLGAATGVVLKYIHERSGLNSFGCEINTWAWTQIPNQMRKRIKLQDMRHYINTCPKVDLIFSNSLMYLEPKEIFPFLNRAHSKCHYFHFHGSFWGDSCPDPYRKILKSLSWWKLQFALAGYQYVKIHGQRESYLWTSKSLGTAPATSSKY